MGSKFFRGQRRGAVERADQPVLRVHDGDGTCLRREDRQRLLESERRGEPSARLNGVFQTRPGPARTVQRLARHVPEQAPVRLDHRQSCKSVRSLPMLTALAW